MPKNQRVVTFMKFTKFVHKISRLSTPKLYSLHQVPKASSENFYRLSC